MSFQVDISDESVWASEILETPGTIQGNHSTCIAHSSPIPTLTCRVYSCHSFVAVPEIAAEEFLITISLRISQNPERCVPKTEVP